MNHSSMVVASNQVINTTEQSEQSSPEIRLARGRNEGSEKWGEDKLFKTAHTLEVSLSAFFVSKCMQQ